MSSVPDSPESDRPDSASEPELAVDAAEPVLPKPATAPRFWRVRRFLAGLNPIALFFGPVFSRDARVLGRRKATYFVRFAVVALPTLLAALVLGSRSGSNAWSAMGGSSAAAQLQSMQDTAYVVAVTISWCQLFMLVLVAPLLTAGTIVEERTARALSVIAASPLSPGRVIGGIFATRTVQLGILALLPLPLVLAIRLFGGLDTWSVVSAWAIAICNALAMLAVGLWASTRATRPAGAVSFSILVLILSWALGPLILLCEVLLIINSQGGMGARGVPVTMPALVLCAPAVLGLIGEPSAAFFGYGSWSPAVMNCGYNLLITAGALLLARRKLAWLIRNDRSDLTRQPSRRRTQVPQGTGEDRLGVMTGSTPISREITGNPVLWRELRQPLFEKRFVRWIGLLGLLGLLVFMHVMSYRLDARDLEAMVIVPSVAALVLMILTAATTPAGTVTTELEARTWAVLLTTPLTPLQILLPKVLGALRRAWPALAFVALNLIICWARGAVPIWAVVFTAVHFAGVSFFLCCTGVAFSLLSRKSAVAATLNLVLCFVLWAIAPIFAGFLLFSGPSNSGDAMGYFLFSNPVFTYGAGIVDLSEWRGRQDTLEMGPLTMTVPAFFLCWMISLMAYASLGAATLWFACSRFFQYSTSRV